MIRRYESPDGAPEGEPLLSTSDVALLCGVSEAELRAESARQRAAGGGDAFRMPAAWIQRGREICARLGTDDLGEALRLLRTQRN